MLPFLFEVCIKTISCIIGSIIISSKVLVLVNGNIIDLYFHELFQSLLRRQISINLEHIAHPIEVHQTN